MTTTCLMAHRIEGIEASEMADRKRLDEILVTRGFFASRTQAKAAIEARQVRSGGEALLKPGREYPTNIELEVASGLRFVSRGGEKLAAFLEQLRVSLEGCHVLDVGASTGGFTDCALQQGAANVTCLDVGQGQLHPRLASDPRVTNIEKVNARYLKPGDLPRAIYDAVVIDVSFISLKLILPAVWPFVQPGGVLITLVKPQFEVGKSIIDAGQGIVRDPRERQRALDEVMAFALKELAGAELIGSMPSPIPGTDGNQEFLVGFRLIDPKTARSPVWDGSTRSGESD